MLTYWIVPGLQCAAASLGAAAAARTLSLQGSSSRRTSSSIGSSGLPSTLRLHGGSLTGSKLLTKFSQTGFEKLIDMADREDIFLRAKHRTFGGLSEGKRAPLTSLRKASALAFIHWNLRPVLRHFWQFDECTAVKCGKAWWFIKGGGWGRARGQDYCYLYL